MVLGLFGDLQSYLKVDAVNIDNHVFKLHYKVKHVNIYVNKYKNYTKKAFFKNWDKILHVQDVM